jgi:hypothetical protein
MRSPIKLLSSLSSLVVATMTSRFPSSFVSSLTMRSRRSQASGLGAQFQRMRRRLTVTGTNETIDGVSKLAVSENDFEKEEVRKSTRLYVGMRVFIMFSSLLYLISSIASCACSLRCYRLCRHFEEGSCPLQSEEKESGCPDNGRPRGYKHINHVRP